MAPETTDPAGAPSGRPGPGPRLATGLVNILTGGRLVLAPVFPLLPESWRLPALVAGGLSDLADGWISRRAGVTSTFGRVVDPIADKALVASVLLTLWHAGDLPLWQIPLVGFRDIVVALGTLGQVALRGWGCVRSMPPSMLGKLATVAQFVFLAALMYHHAGALAALAIATALSVAAGLGYLSRRPPADDVADASHPASRPAPCDSSATTSTRASAAATGSTESPASST